MNIAPKNSPESDVQEKAILIIDDEPSNLGVLAEYLEEYGFEVLVARNGKTGLEKAQFVHPDLILLDIVMPGIDGFETCRRLKATEDTKDIPVMFMTALTETEHKIKGFQVGAVDYITKPFQKEEVLVRVTTHLRLRELTEQLEQKVQERTRELTIANQRLKREIAERKQAEETLRESEERYRTFITHSSEGIYRIDVVPPVPIDLPRAEIVKYINEHAIVAEVNDALADMYGLTTEEMIGKLATDFAPDYGVRAELVLQNKDYQVTHEETLDVDKEGFPLYLEESYHGEIYDGHLVRIWGVQRNITEHKQAENLLRIQRDLALALSAESDMKKVADRLLEHLLQIEEFDCGGIYLVDENTGALDLIAHTGVPRQFVEQRTHFEADTPQTRFVMAGTPSYGSYAEILPEIKNQVRQQEGLRALALIPVLFEGQVIAALNLASHTYTETPMPIRNALETIATTHIGEVLARIKAETALQALNTELEQRVKHRTAELEAANKELKDFAYVVSHDLKAPLRGISRLAQWLVADYTDAFNEQGKEMIDLLVGRVKRMDSLIDGILHYSRVGRLIGRDEQIDLNTLVKDVIDMLAPPEHIHISFENELPVIIGDKIRIAEVFQNLLSNAIEFMDKSDGKITIGCVDRGSHWKFSVADNGPGIDKRYHEKIFQVFQTLTPRDEHESTGIGLALVKKIVELHGGKIWVESTAGEGSVFFFTLPKKEEK